MSADAVIDRRGADPGRATLDLIIQPGLRPEGSLAADRALLDEMRAAERVHAGALRVYALEGEVLSLGRYHLVPTPADPRIRLSRRHSGGRAMPWGAGFVGISLVLPHRSALVASDPLALGPDQVLNRYVRGLLAACELSGVAAFYPGRDLITVDRRLLAMASFAVEADGTFLFEAVLANERDFSDLPGLLDRADPDGVVRAGMLTPDDTTSLARLLGRGLEVAELAARLRLGYEQHFALRFLERSFAARGVFDEAGWLGQRGADAALDRRVSVPCQLGVFELHSALEAGRIRDVRLVGDFIANAPAVTRVEDALRGCAVERSAIEGAVGAVLGEPGNFILGLGPSASVAETIARGLAP